MQNIKLNLIPGAVMPVVNVSQYDKARQFSLTVYEGSATYSLTGKSVQIRGTKPDGNGFAYDSTDGVVSVSGSTVTISTTQQMTAVGGQTMAELRITQSGVILGTLNFVLMVEPSALSDDTPISDTDIPAIERDFEAALEEAEADALKAEGYAVGTQDGTPAQSGEPYYQDNAKYYKEQAEAAASGTGGDALKAEGYAVGEQNGTPVGPGSPYYQNNAAYYDGTARTAAETATTKAGEASTSATNAGNSATAAATDSLEAEGWANGKQNGTPVTSGSPYYHNNAEYYKDQAAQYAAGGLIFKGSVAFASIPTTGMVNGDMYNITDDFTTDNRFIEGSGVSVKAGADIAWVAGSVNKWDILALGGGSDDYSQLTNKPQINSHTLTGDQTAAALGLASDAAMTGASAGDAGAKGLVPAPAAGDQDKVLCGDGTWKTPSSSSDMTGATSSTPGAHGLVPAPAAGDNTKFLRGDGTWAEAGGGGGSTPKVYGAVWDGSADSSWTRTDDAATFSDPQPYYSGMAGTPSSPFDLIMPWAGMQKIENASAGTVVSIPKFYYKMGYASGSTGLKIQIVSGDNATWALANGYSVSPAHQDRGDGVGERNWVYVGRYHSASDYKSKTGVSPKVSTTRSAFRSGISALGSSVWQMDFATLITIWMLYLVEFADWNSQGKIGGGCTATTASASNVFTMGSTDSMPYHTGTVSSSIGPTVYGCTQYRYIEGLWDNCFTFIDGIYFTGSDVNIILDPANFSDSSGGTKVGTRPSPSGSSYISAYEVSSISGYEWFIFPSAVAGSDSTYICDAINYNTGNSILCYGGSFYQSQQAGLFFLITDVTSSTADIYRGSRLMVLP